MEIRPGTRVRRYEVTAPLGAGGMGEVYLARDVELERTVALKVLPQDVAASAERIRRFVQEAKAAIALNHPNVAHVYDVGDENGVRFMAMEYVEGETLRARMARGPLALDEAIDIATQIASALASAHAHGVVHRDIKPENVMLRPDGYVKVLDFGLAKLVGTATAPPTDATAAIETDAGVVMGTMHYMSPEQLCGEEVDARTDLFSLGIVLYEMVSGHRPFEASTPSGVIAAILTAEPKPIDAAAIRPELGEIVTRALEKKRENRYADAGGMRDALKHCSKVSSGEMPTQVLTGRVARKSHNWLPITIAAVVVIALVAIGVTFSRRLREQRDAVAAIARAEELAGQHRYFEAYDVAMTAAPIRGNTAEFERAMQKICDEVEIITDPPGAQVTFERVSGGETTARTPAGPTPLRRHRIPRGDYVINIEKQGFAPVAMSFSNAPLIVNGGVLRWPTRPIERELRPAADIPPGMVYVPGGRYRLLAWSRPSRSTLELAPFAIGRFEVTNREFAEFVQAGGYARPELWKVPFVKDGRTLGFEEAMALLRDTTSQPGPRSWAAQTFPQGRENHPVTDVTWYEAGAYAAFRGMALPTLFQWEKAAREGQSLPYGFNFPWGVQVENNQVTVRANFRGNGPMAVESLRAGISPHGAYHMAGNVREWCRNAGAGGYYTAGGGFDEPAYSFGRSGSYPGFYSSPSIGFRLVELLAPAGAEEGSMDLAIDPTPKKYEPIDDAGFARLRAEYDYDAAAPLHARVVEVAETPSWRRETIEFAGARGDKTTAYLYLPRHVAKPFQLIHFIPAADVSRGLRSLSESAEHMAGPLMRNGRALFAVVLRGYYGRPWPPTRQPASPASEQFAAEMVDHITDLRRGLDYLATRNDVDSKRIALYGPSSGADTGLIVAAVEPRYASAMFTGAGLNDNEETFHPIVRRINFVPRIRAPKLMLNGRYDEGHLLRSHAEPLFALFREPKKFVVYDGGHVPPLAVAVPTFTSWLDQTLGPVKR